MAHSSSSKSKHRDRDDETRDRDGKRIKKEHRTSSSHHSSSSRHKRDRPVPAAEEEDEWVEKPSELPPASAPGGKPEHAPVPALSGEREERDGAGLGLLAKDEQAGGDGTSGGSGDWFSSLGTERKRKEIKRGVDPTETMGQSSRELNKSHWQPSASLPASIPVVLPSGTPTPAAHPTPGSSGSLWRLKKLQRTYEIATEESRDLNEVIMERYGEGEDGRLAWDAALEEGRWAESRGGRGTPSNARRMGQESREGSRPGSRQEFRRYDEDPSSARRTGGDNTPLRSMVMGRPGAPGTGTPGVRTPIQSVFTPTLRTTSSSNLVPQTSSTTAPAAEAPLLTQSELNKFQARVLKARLLDDPNGDSLEAEYNAAREVFLKSAGQPMAGERVEVMPTLDARGRMYDTGIEMPKKEGEVVAMGRQRGNGRIRKEKEGPSETYDPSTGTLLTADPDADVPLAELLRREKLSGGNNGGGGDAELAEMISRDAKFALGEDYQDENSLRLARRGKGGRKEVVLADYARTKKALENCTLCSATGAPLAAIVAHGQHAYLSLMPTQELVKGHCRIVPFEHVSSTLECEEEEWTEIKNFKKTLMQMFAEQDRGVVFIESVLRLKNHSHSYIECIPVPFSLFDELPAYFSEALLTSGTVWSTHPLIKFSASRPFRRSMVPNLNHFMVMFDYKGEKGYGHVVEEIDDAEEMGTDGELIRGEVGEKGGGKFENYFAQEIIGNLLDLMPNQWRKPKRIPWSSNQERIKEFRVTYDQWDWTKMLAAA